MWSLLLVALIIGGVFLLIGKAASEQNKGEIAKADRALAVVPGFRPALTEGTGWNKPGISIDPVSERFAIVTPNQPPKVYRFDQLVAVEVTRDGSSVTKTNRGNQIAGAAAGALLLGPAGLLLGGLTRSTRQEEKIKRVSLKLYTNDLSHPVVDFPFLDQWVGVAADSYIVKNAARRADEWYGRFQAILHGQAVARSSAPAPPSPSPARNQPLTAREAASVRREGEQRSKALLDRIEHRRLRRSSATTIDPSESDHLLRQETINAGREQERWQY